MDTFLLSRIQFGLSVGVHFLFPVASLGLAFYIVLVEGFYLKTKNEVYRHISTFAVKVLALIFAMGVATGIIMPFAFGTNWAGFVSFASSVFGIHLTIEALVAFMLESVFLGVLLFGRNKVKPGVYFFAALMVFLGSHLSAFFIISANSWMQTPFHSLATLASGIPIPEIDGFHLQTLADGTTKVVMDDVWKIMFNPTTVIRFIHTITACWLTGAVVMGAISAWFMLKHKQTKTAVTALTFAAVIGLITGLAQPIIGHSHIMETLKWQPTKNAAMEGIFKTQEGAPLYALGWVDEKERKTNALGVPFMLSFLEAWNFTAEVKGLDDIVAEGQAEMAASGGTQGEYKAFAPPVQPVFQMFHLMVMMGVALIAVMGYAVLSIVRKKTQGRLLHWAMVAIIPLPFIAVEAGWIGAEIGRQPWIIYGLMKTVDAVSVIPVEYVGFSLVVFSLVYVSLFVLLFRWLPPIIKEGLEEHFAKGAE